ncbi:hypothetical protein K2P47_03970 [Patescibacteria group bacterium]|nr:hypothetical protein [Patescibacteria group bacterium]
MTRLSSRAHALYEAAEEAVVLGFKNHGQSKEVSVHRWLSAEVRFADEVGIGFVIAPQKPPAEDWQYQAYKSIADALRLIRKKQFSSVVRTNA